MNSKHLIAQVQKNYPLLADRMTVYANGQILIQVSNVEVEDATKMVNAQAEKWQELAMTVKEQFGYRKMRNSGILAAGYCHGAVFRLNDAESIIVTVNEIFKTIGIYFDHYKTADRHMPFPGARSATISYWPYSKSQAECAVNITDILLAHFPDFAVFNNLHASLYISESLICDYEEEELDLFQVLFSTNIHGGL